VSVAVAARDRERALLVAAVALAVGALAAAVTAIGFAPAARRSLDYGFAGVPPRLGEALAILGNNARIGASVASAIVIVQAARLERTDRTLGRLGRLLRGACDVALAVAIVVNAATVGEAVGAYGSRMLVAMLPHGPIELAGYALAVALYLRARERLLGWGVTLRLASWSLALLALAALLETFAAL
jgi:hypothetical protein